MVFSRANGFVVGFKVVTLINATNASIAVRLGGEIIHSHTAAGDGQGVKETYVPVLAPSAQFLGAIERSLEIACSNTNQGAAGLAITGGNLYFRVYLRGSNSRAFAAAYGI